MSEKTKVTMENLEVDDGGRFDQEVVGESYCQETLKVIEMDRHPLDKELGFSAYLIPERDNPHDPNAVAVMSAEESLRVGYIPRQDAAKLAPIVHALFERRRFFSCPAKLIGGTPGKPNLGVVLDLPAADVLILAASDAPPPSLPDQARTAPGPTAPGPPAATKQAALPKWIIRLLILLAVLLIMLVSF